jgi:hypothetical protein
LRPGPCECYWRRAEAYMFSANIKVQDIDGAHWRRFLSLLSHPLPSIGTHPAKVPVVLFLENNRLQKALRIGEGVLTGISWGGPDSLPALHKELNASWILAVEAEALSALMQEYEVQWKFGQDIASDAMGFIQLLRAKFGQGFYMYPRPFANLLIPPIEVWKRFIDLLLPDGFCIAFYVFEHQQIWTSFIIGKQAGEIDLLTTHDALRPAPPMDQWRTDARLLVNAISKQIRPVQIGLFAEKSVWLSLLASGSRTAFASAASEGTVLLEPAPSWLRMLLGVGRWVDVVSREVEKRTGPLGNLFGRGRTLGEALSRAVGLTPERLDPMREFLAKSLGVDLLAPDSPMQFLATLFRKEPQSPQPQSPDRE